MSNYKDSKEKLNKIRQEYTCKGDVIFNSAVHYTIEVGQATLNGETWFKKALEEIDNRHDEADAEGKYLFMTRDFEKAIVECARKIAEINTHDLMVYIQREMYLNSGMMDGEPDYQRAIEIIKECMDYINMRCSFDNYCDWHDTIDAFKEIDINEDELIYFGYQDLLEEEEEE